MKQRERRRDCDTWNLVGQNSPLLAFDGKGRCRPIHGASRKQFECDPMVAKEFRGGTVV